METSPAKPALWVPMTMTTIDSRLLAPASHEHEAGALAVSDSEDDEGEGHGPLALRLYFSLGAMLVGGERQDRPVSVSRPTEVHQLREKGAKS